MLVFSHENGLCKKMDLSRSPFGFWIFTLFDEKQCIYINNDSIHSPLMLTEDIDRVVKDYDKALCLSDLIISAVNEQEAGEAWKERILQ